MNPADELMDIAERLPFEDMELYELCDKLKQIAEKVKPKRREYPGYWEAQDRYVVHSATEQVIMIAKSKYEASNMCELHNRYYG